MYYTRLNTVIILPWRTKQVLKTVLLREMTFIIWFRDTFVESTYPYQINIIPIIHIGMYLVESAKFLSLSETAISA